MSLDYYVVGNLSNIIFRDGNIETPIINIKNYNEIIVEDEPNKFKYQRVVEFLFLNL